jgi:hypothetical protein
VLVPQSHSQAMPTQKFSPDPILPSEAQAESPLTVTVNDADAPKPSAVEQVAVEQATVEPAAIAVDNPSSELAAPTIAQDPRNEVKDPCLACGMG